ncbi:MAG TPA: acylphosphatase [Gemmatimonadales bacterium]|nr:acylphosphatase [Gemmatimonadales bacterium]
MTVRFIVTGLVQGVGFRFFVARRAAALGITGHAANLPDGRVEVVASGSPEALASLERALWEGPARARVAGVEKSQISDEAIASKTFEIR